jgi:threonine/homoserine efflux transporter RhtA
MTFDSTLFQPIVALLAGVLILVQPSLLSDVIALYLIIVGVVGLVHHFKTNR